MRKVLFALICLVLMISLLACTGEPISGAIDLAGEDSAVSGGTVAPENVTNDAYNYLTGEYTLASDRVGLRPICVSVNNISVSWPQKGTSFADVIVEMETEGGITRFMCMYADPREVEIIGSVRSLRDQFIAIVYPVDPLIVHIGTSIYAEKAITEHNMRTIDGGYLPQAIFVDQTRVGRYDTEHTKFTSGENIEKAIASGNFDMNSSSIVDSFLNFAKPDETIIPASGPASAVVFDYSGSGYDGDFRYDATSGMYLKFQRGRPHMDGYNDQQLAFDNVFVIFADIQNRRDATELIDFNYQAGGTAYYFSQGQYEQLTWYKLDYNAPFVFVRADGSEMPVNTGKSLIAVIRNTYYSSFEITP